MDQNMSESINLIKGIILGMIAILGFLFKFVLKRIKVYSFSTKTSLKGDSISFVLENKSFFKMSVININIIYKKKINFYLKILKNH